MSEVAGFGICILVLITFNHLLLRIAISKLETKVDELYMLLRDLRREMRK